MATISRPSRTTDSRSGGKVVKRGRIVAERTPYDRPSPPPYPSPKSPNWLTGLVFPTTWTLAIGAGRLLSSFFTADASSSSSSSSSSDSDSCSEDDVDDKNDGEVPSDGMMEELNKKNGTSAEMNKCFIKEPHLTVGKNETMRVIEQLVMQETFSREERDRLTKIISSRVVDCSTIYEGQDEKPSEIPNRTFGSGTSDLYSKAVIEAKRWLEEKKVGSSPKSDLDYGMAAYNSVVLQHVTEGDVGSPVDMAKSYMRSRPPWVSSSTMRIELRTPSPVVTALFKEGTSYSAGVSSFSSSKKRDSLASGSWNIQEEIRRVRSKATVDMLHSLPSTKIDLSSFALDPKTVKGSSVAAKAVTCMNDKTHESNYLPATKLIDASTNMASGVSTCDGFPVLEMRHNGIQNEALSSHAAAFISKQNQKPETIKIVGGGGAASRYHHSITLELPSEQYNDPKPNDGNCSIAKEATEFSGTPSANCLPSSQSSLSAGLGPTDEENPVLVSSSNDKVSNSIPMEDTCELLSEAYMEVPPVVNEINSIASVSQNSSSMRYEELPQEPCELTTKSSLLAGSMVVKQQMKKPGRRSRRGRGKG